MRSNHILSGAVAIIASSLFVAGMASAADANAGHEAFLRYGCYTCHGYEGQGANTGPKLAPDPLPYEALSTFVRQSSGPMPPFTPATLPDETLMDIYAYLQSRTAPPDPNSDPLLRDLEP